MLAQRGPDGHLGGRPPALDELRLARVADYSSGTCRRTPHGVDRAPRRPSPATRHTRSAGLPPAPICTPTVASIDAALAPDTTNGYLYFVAIPGGDGTHDFSKTYEEHLAKLKKYGYTK